MSGYQIPGLGQAKPNETLPPLTPDLVIAAVSAAEDDEMKDSHPSATNHAENSEMNIQSAPSTEDKTSESMVVDQPESPPSLTHALEAALGGFDDASTDQQQPIVQEPAPLQPDQSEQPEWEVDSSPYESSSDSSSSDSSSDEDSDNEGYEPLGVEETARILMETEGGSDDEGDRSKTLGAGYTRTKNEIPDELIPLPDITITPEMKIDELGVIENIVDNILLIKAFTPGEYQVLDTGSILCKEDRSVFGVVAETIGKVLQPMYTVLFNSGDQLAELGLAVGTKVFYPVDHATFVFTQPLKNLKGSDASNLHDEEVGAEEMEFSDDEMEADYKRSLKQKKKDKWKNTNGKDDREPHPLRQQMSADGGLNYDEEDDGPYKPLARPAGYGNGPQSVDNYEPPPRSGFQRGGRRGDSRGRGGRGRGSGRGGRGGNTQRREGYSLPPQGLSQGSNQYPQHPPSHPAATVGPPAPSLPNFGFPVPGWPQQPPTQGAAAVPPPPPPPPGWPGAGQAQGQAPNNGAFVNPAFFAALMSQIQQNQGGQAAWGQAPPQPPPSGGQGP